jgi:hypothetical protein
MHDSWDRPSPIRLGLLILVALLTGLGLTLGVAGNLDAYDVSCAPGSSHAEAAACAAPAGR